MNRALNIHVLGDPGPGGGYNHYTISNQPDANYPPNVHVALKFQSGNPALGVNGLTNEALLAVVLDRLARFQIGPFGCEDNQSAMYHCRQALVKMAERSRKREERGVEGQAVP